MGDEQFLALPSGPAGSGSMVPPRRGECPGRSNARRIYPVRRSVLSVAVAGFTLAVSGPGFSQISTTGPAPIQRGTFNLAQAYPATSGSYTGTSPVLISPNGCWNPSIQGFNEQNPTVQAPTLESRCSFTQNPTLNGVGPLGRTGFAVAGVL